MASRDKTCPKCAAKIAPSDTVCIECGGPLIPDTEEDSTRLTTGVVAAPSVGGAAAGMAEAGETSEKTRLRVFDEQLAEQLQKERPATLVLAVISLVAAVVLTSVANGFLQRIGGFSAITDMDLAVLRAKRLAMFTDPQLLFIIAGGLALAGYLCGVGEGFRFVAACRAIAAVKAGQSPDVVGVTILTRVGLLIAAFLFPPLGIIVGIIFKLSNSNESKELGSQMIYLALLAVAIALVSILWDVAAEMAQTHKPPPRVTPR